MDSAAQFGQGPLIEVKGLTLAYGKRELVHDACAEFRAGHLIALIGRNGSGKSTLLRAMAGLKNDYKGRIEVSGNNLHRIHAAGLSRLIAFVGTGRARVERFTCYDLVALGRAPYTNWIGSLGDSDRAAVEAALEAVGMTAYAGRMLDSLSDGECQRVMIARALAQDTPVILLDEPTSFLDLPNRYELVSLLASLAHERKKCIIYSTHELDIALEHSDRIGLINPPELITGTPDELRADIRRAFGFDVL
ncbi:MAG: ABC transporter ATP-binding protein [Muribaculaceae bacterium]|nr:ABC transporter ATP-binding protein [Muribaculaceae bacterium]